MRKKYSKNSEKFYRDILRTLFRIQGHHHASCFLRISEFSKNSHTDTFQSHQTPWLNKKYKVKFYLHTLMACTCMKVNQIKNRISIYKKNKIKNWKLFTKKSVILKIKFIGGKA